jgi:uncharacterized protein YkwD
MYFFSDSWSSVKRARVPLARGALSGQERRRSVKCFVAALFTGLLFSWAAVAQTGSVTQPAVATGSQQLSIDTNKAVEAVFSGTNAYRTEKSVKELEWHDALSQAAQQYAEFLAANKASGHVADGKNPQTRAQEQGYKCPVSEDAFSDEPSQTTDDEETAGLKAIESWKSSAPDEANMVSPLSIYTGAGAAAWTHDSETYYVFVQMFGRQCGVTQPRPAPVVTPSPGLNTMQPGPAPLLGPGTDLGVAPFPVPGGKFCRHGGIWPRCHHICQNGGIWPRCIRTCPKGGVWPRCNRDCANGGVWPHCHHPCPNGGVWPRCHGACPNGGIWPHCKKPAHRPCWAGGFWPHCKKPVSGRHCPRGGIWPRCNRLSGMKHHFDWRHRPGRFTRPNFHRSRFFNHRRSVQRRPSTVKWHQSRRTWGRHRH